MTTSVPNVHTEDASRSRAIQITVNNQPVDLSDRETTGLGIKQAAIAQGVAIQANFQLSVKRGHRYDVIGDDDPITVHPHEEFIAVAPDDNS